MNKHFLQKVIPNFLTSFRCLSAIIVPLLIIYGDEKGAWLAPIIFIIAGITDFFDGYLARKFNVISNFGKIIDPVADKMLVIGTLFALSSENFFNYYYTFIPAFIIILREIFITGLREQVSKDKITLNVSMLAKWKTTIQLIACSSYLIWRSDNFFFQSVLIEYTCISLLWIASFITIITCYDYLKKVWGYL
tara:strand:+ start:335 stop:910 length:576 start_codon:yes stop_codon:yes gene_type:complete